MHIYVVSYGAIFKHNVNVIVKKSHKTFIAS